MWSVETEGDSVWVFVVLFDSGRTFLALRLYSLLGKRTGHEQQRPAAAAEERVGAPPMPRTIDMPAEGPRSVRAQWSRARGGTCARWLRADPVVRRRAGSSRAPNPPTDDHSRSLLEGRPLQTLDWLVEGRGARQLRRRDRVRARPRARRSTTGWSRSSARDLDIAVRGQDGAHHDALRRRYRGGDARQGRQRHRRIADRRGRYARRLGRSAATCAATIRTGSSATPTKRNWRKRSLK